MQTEKHTLARVQVITGWRALMRLIMQGEVQTLFQLCLLGSRAVLTVFRETERLSKSRNPAPDRLHRALLLDYTHKP